MKKRLSKYLSKLNRCLDIKQDLTIYARMGGEDTQHCKHASARWWTPLIRCSILTCFHPFEKSWIESALIPCSGARTCTPSRTLPIQTTLDNFTSLVNARRPRLKTFAKTLNDLHGLTQEPAPTKFRQKRHHPLRSLARDHVENVIGAYSTLSW